MVNATILHSHCPIILGNVNAVLSHNSTPILISLEAHISHSHIALMHVLGVPILDLHYDLLWIELYTYCLVSSTFQNNFSFHHHENSGLCPLTSCFDERHFCKKIETAINTKRHIRDITIISHLMIYIIHQTQYQPSTGENLFNAIDSLVNIAPTIVHFRDYAYANKFSPLKI